MVSFSAIATEFVFGLEVPDGVASDASIDARLDRDSNDVLGPLPRATELLVLDDGTRMEVIRGRLNPAPGSLRVNASFRDGQQLLVPFTLRHVVVGASSGGAAR